MWSMMTIIKRSFHRHVDFDKVRKFLIDTYQITNTFHNWIPSMFENSWRGPCGPPYKDAEDEYVKIWEEEKTGIVAVTISKPCGEFRIFIHPEFRNFEETLVEALETQFKEMKKNDTKTKMYFIVEAGDTLRERLLENCGYENKGVCEHNRILPHDYNVPQYTLPEDYTIRHVDIEKDFENYRAVQGSVFSHCGEFMTLEAAKIYSEADFYHSERDIVVVAPDGSFAAFATGRMDPISKLAEVEPVGVHPNHRRKGLGKAIVLECIRRLQKHGAIAIVILGAASTEEATRLYDSLGFSRTNVHVWVKEV
ncbi:GNAT family N-acetyltransferase [Candidatus Thorarchaeota archaeon]|nr:MAG: GNAT family N-acetyltransferase [Candidatus Thorarchaeota archaeon]